MNKLKRRLIQKRYYEKNKEHILFYKREYRLKNNNRKYYRNDDRQDLMPVDLFIMRNKQKFNEGFNPDY